MNDIFHQPEFVEVCKEFEVKELHAFGSILGQAAEKAEDIDLLVEFKSRRLRGGL